MPKIDYILLGIDEDGNTLIDCSTTADQAVLILAQALELSKSATPSPTPPETLEAPPPVSGRGRKPKIAYNEKAHVALQEKLAQKEPCSECGSKGWRHFKTCSKNKQSSTGTLPNEQRAGAMTKSQFDRVKLADQHGISPDVIQGELRLSAKEVKRAMLAPNYEKYLT